MVEVWLGSVALQLVPLEPVNYVEFLVASMESVTRAVARDFANARKRNCRRVWKRIGREAISFCCRKGAFIWVTSGALSLRSA